MIKMLFVILLISQLYCADHGFQIFCVSDDQSNKTLIIDDTQIEKYHWYTHEIVLNKFGIDNLKKMSIHCKKFEIYLNGTDLYSGKFESASKSEISIKTTSILISPTNLSNIIINGNKFKIWYMGDSIDCRNNTTLKTYLKNKKLLY